MLKWINQSNLMLFELTIISTFQVFLPNQSLYERISSRHIWFIKKGLNVF